MLKTGGGQILICTAGEGWYQEEGKDAVSLLAQRKTVGFPIFLWRRWEKKPQMNGVSL